MNTFLDSLFAPRFRTTLLRGLTRYGPEPGKTTSETAEGWILTVLLEPLALTVSKDYIELFPTNPMMRIALATIPTELLVEIRNAPQVSSELLEARVDRQQLLRQMLYWILVVLSCDFYAVSMVRDIFHIATINARAQIDRRFKALENEVLPKLKRIEAFEERAHTLGTTRFNAIQVFYSGDKDRLLPLVSSLAKRLIPARKHRAIEELPDCEPPPHEQSVEGARAFLSFLRSTKPAGPSATEIFIKNEAESVSLLADEAAAILQKNRSLHSASSFLAKFEEALCSDSILDSAHREIRFYAAQGVHHTHSPSAVIAQHLTAPFDD